MRQRPDPIIADPIIVGCGALVRELRVVFDQLGIDEPTTRWLPANLHNRPERIAAAVTTAIDELADSADQPVLVAYGDCGTGGLLDAALDQYPNAARLPGDHCYEFFAGSAAFAQLAEAELGTFYLTDYLALHFDALVWTGLGLDRHPQLADMYFGNYRRLVWLAQGDDRDTEHAARAAADRLGLEFVRHDTGLEPVSTAIETAVRLGQREPST